MTATSEIISLPALAKSVEDAKARVAAIEKMVEERDGVARVRKHLQMLKVSSATLNSAPNDYYSWSLAKRASVFYLS